MTTIHYLEKIKTIFKNIGNALLDSLFFLPHIIIIGLLYHSWFNSDVSRDFILFIVIVYFYIKVNNKLSGKLGMFN